MDLPTCARWLRGVNTDAVATDAMQLLRENLKDLLKGKSHSAIAAAAGFSKSHLANVKNIPEKALGIDRIGPLADALNVPVARLFEARAAEGEQGGAQNDAIATAGVTPSDASSAEGASEPQEEVASMSSQPSKPLSGAALFAVEQIEELPPGDRKAFASDLADIISDWKRRRRARPRGGGRKPAAGGG